MTFCFFKTKHTVSAYKKDKNLTKPNKSTVDIGIDTFYIANRNRSKSRSDQQVQCWNCGKTGHFRNQCKSPKKKNGDDSANAVTEEVQDALLLAVDSPLDD